MEVHGAPPPTLNFGGADPHEVRGTPFETRAPAPHPPDHLLIQPAAARSVEHSFHRAARRPDGRSASGAGDSAPSNPASDDSPASARALPAPICEPRANPDCASPRACRRPSSGAPRGGPPAVASRAQACPSRPTPGSVWQRSRRAAWPVRRRLSAVARTNPVAVPCAVCVLGGRCDVTLRRALKHLSVLVSGSYDGYVGP